jgi:hypothetical protein
MRRSNVVLMLAGLLAIPAVASAQATDLAVTRQQIQADRQAIVAANLPMDEATASKFWPLYQEYRAALAKVVDKRQALLTAPVQGDSLTEKVINQTLQDWVKTGVEYAQTQQNYVKKFQAVLGGRGTIRYYQIEKRLDLIVEASLASSIPLVPAQ